MGVGAEQLSKTARHMTSGAILAADESSGTIQKRFDKIGLKSNPDTNRAYRQLLFSTPAISRYISGVILYDETIRQSDDHGLPFSQLLAGKGIVPGIKVDTGTADLEGYAPDKFTKGLEGLAERLGEYRNMGARFAKWRATYSITEDGNHPSREIIERNARDLATYAAICQENGIVPIVEPEVLMEGNHDIDVCADVTRATLTMVFEELKKNNVQLTGMVLKPNMVVPGSESENQLSPEAVAHTTLEVLRATVSPEIPGIAFLSGGLTADEATEDLEAINVRRIQEPEKYPWERVTASFGRALQSEAIDAWGGKIENVVAAQAALLSRAKKVFYASNGQTSPIKLPRNSS